MFFIYLKSNFVFKFLVVDKNGFCLRNIVVFVVLYCGIIVFKCDMNGGVIGMFIKNGMRIRNNIFCFFWCEVNFNWRFVVYGCLLYIKCVIL